MTRAIVKMPFKGAPDGEIHPRDFAVGDEVEGDLALVAIREKWAKPVPAQKSLLGGDEDKALPNAPENKVKRRRNPSPAE